MHITPLSVARRINKIPFTHHYPQVRSVTQSTDWITYELDPVGNLDCGTGYSLALEATDICETECRLIWFTICDSLYDFGAHNCSQVCVHCISQ